MTTARGDSTQPAQSGSSDATHDDGLAAFLRVRPRVFGIAYRMLRCVAEADDIVQDVWLRWQTTDRTVVRDAAAFLATTATRLAINVIQSARSRRETRVGLWMPEPVDTRTEAKSGRERNERLKAGVLLLLEKLSPTERAVYILREAFEYKYGEIARLLQLREANVRQLAARARRHLANGHGTPSDAPEQRRLLAACVAVRRGDMAGLVDLLASHGVSADDAAEVTDAPRPRSGSVAIQDRDLTDRRVAA